MTLLEIKENSYVVRFNQ